VPDPVQPVVTDATERARYEAHLGDELAGFLEYVVKHGRIALVHTEVPPEYEGQGVASALVRHALDDARARAASDRYLRVRPGLSDATSRG